VTSARDIAIAQLKEQKGVMIEVKKSLTESENKRLLTEGRLPKEIVVEGAGAEINGTYRRVENWNGFPRFVREGKWIWDGPLSTTWFQISTDKRSKYWLITIGNSASDPAHDQTIELYKSPTPAKDDFLLPPRTGWQNLGGGFGCSPSLTFIFDFD